MCLCKILSSEKCKLCGDWTLLIFRILVGFLFATHGASKLGLMGDGSVTGFAAGVGIPVWLAFIAAFIEFAGGLAIAFGLFTRVFAGFAAIELVVAYIMAHAPKGWNPVNNGGELALVYIACFILLFGVGAGKFSLDTLLCSKCKCKKDV